MKTRHFGFQLIIIMLVIQACGTDIEKKSKSVKTKKIDTTKYTKHTLYSDEMTIALDKNFERFNIDELIEVTKNQPKTSFMNRIFNEQKLQLSKLLGATFYVFVDTTNYQNFIHLERLDNKIPINKKVASMIGGVLKKNIEVSHLNSNVEITSAKFGKQPTYTYGYYSMTSTSNEFISYSNHYAISASKSSYIIYNIGSDNMDFSGLKTHISFK